LSGRRAVEYTVFGVVQGVGFRPFVFRLAEKLGLAGWVKNSGGGVEIHVEGPGPAVEKRFPELLKKELPPLARIERLEARPAAFQGRRDFRIRKTKEESGFVFISPDIATCDDCLEEVRTAGERRFRYPFTNCTNCGPRYTIVLDLPYDRPKTTMAGFRMCPDCRREYEDPHDRRHHAQPIACPRCGPRVSLRHAATGRTESGGIEEAAGLIRQGKILAVKGLGGFHLVCDPFHARTVRRLRRLKSRQTKPLALMARDLEEVERYAQVGRVEKELLLSPERPIVLLKKKTDIPLIAPHLDEIGFMLPYTPLHHLLLEGTGLIVATSSNSKDAPIMKDEAEGVAGLCDHVLTHDRPIAMRADDSVTKVAGGRRLFVRRARGFVPYPQPVPPALRSDRMLLALGGELKDTVSVYKDGYVVTSQFLGDLDDYRNFGYFRETLEHLERLFDVRPAAVITDLHPDFRTTRFARGLGLPHYTVQHHFAHVLAVMLEHGLPPGKKVLGVVLDGYGYGADGSAWGAEFLLADYSGFERFAAFQTVRLPGGDLASREPWRMALAYLALAFGDKVPDVPELALVEPASKQAVLGMIRQGLRSPLASSCGRLFDAVSFLAGLAPVRMEFEAEAAMRLEAACDLSETGAYPFKVAPAKSGSRYEVSFLPLIRSVLKDRRRDVPAGKIAARFHNSLARAVAESAALAREQAGVDTVALSGGCFLNRRLLEAVEPLLAAKGFKVLRPTAYSPNDESVSVGQIAWGLLKLRA
jgi:hydrogenase maturation protein HypF